jgi:hypothetical protein
MSIFNGLWLDEGGLQITIQQSENILTKVTYNTGRGPFLGFAVDLGCPVLSINFTDGKTPAAGVQAGVLNFDQTTIYWSNGTVWKKELAS